MATRNLPRRLHAGYTRQAVNNWYRDNKFPASSYVLITVDVRHGRDSHPRQRIRHALAKETPMSNGTVWTPLMEKRLEKLVEQRHAVQDDSRDCCPAEFSVHAHQKLLYRKGQTIGVATQDCPKEATMPTKKKAKKPAKRGKKKAPAKPKKKKRKPASPGAT